MIIVNVKLQTVSLNYGVLVRASLLANHCKVIGLSHEEDHPHLIV